MNENSLIKSHMLGDSLLLPYEFLKKPIAKKRLSRLGLRQSLIGHYGATSDDSDHIYMTFMALEKSQGDIKKFRKILRKYLKLWILTLPPGIGFTTLKSIFKMYLCLNKSGVQSGGNGPLMRVPMLACAIDGKEKRDNWVRVSTELTHLGESTLQANFAMADFINFLKLNKRLPSFLELSKLLDYSNPEWIKYKELLLKNLDSNLDDFMKNIDCSQGVSGYIMHTSVAVIYFLYNSKSPQEAFELVIKASGDTDTIGAVLGSCLSCLYDMNDLIEKNKILFDFTQENFWTKLLLKNIIITPIILAHGMYRFWLYFKYYVLRIQK